MRRTPRSLSLARQVLFFLRCSVLCPLCPDIASPFLRQIVLRGKNKYLVNGHNVPQKVVSNLFQSVQLNVNNPHFLIMQGRITKVLNMKPPETLSMIEEAAGTRMFEDKKEAAIATISKKEKKLEEIQTVRQLCFSLFVPI